MTEDKRQQFALMRYGIIAPAFDKVEYEVDSRFVGKRIYSFCLSDK
jgi:hypothetical protein